MNLSEMKKSFLAKQNLLQNRSNATLSFWGKSSIVWIKIGTLLSLLNFIYTLYKLFIISLSLSLSLSLSIFLTLSLNIYIYISTMLTKLVKIILFLPIFPVLKYVLQFR